ncbi:hypothetical protein SLE2022_133010 [Rubroshorea leprosula]
MDSISSTSGPMMEHKEGLVEGSDLKKTPEEMQEQLESNRVKESDNGQIEEQRGRREKQSRNRRRRRVESCFEVYERSIPIRCNTITFKDNSILGWGAWEMWKFVKELGIEIDEDEEDLVRKIARLEERDKVRKKKDPKIE